MTTKVQSPIFGGQVTQNGALTLDGVELFGLMADAIRELQASPVFEGGAGPILTSPDGTQYRLTVDNAGSLSTVAI